MACSSSVSSDFFFVHFTGAPNGEGRSKRIESPSSNAVMLVGVAATGGAYSLASILAMPKGVSRSTHSLPFGSFQRYVFASIRTASLGIDVNACGRGVGEGVGFLAAAAGFLTALGSSEANPETASSDTKRKYFMCLILLPGKLTYLPVPSGRPCRTGCR